MARNNSTTSYGNTDLIEISKNLKSGVVTQQDFPRSASRAGYSLTRPDITRREANEVGWRDPTPYSHSKLEAGWYAGMFGMRQIRRYLTTDYEEQVDCQFTWPDLNFTNSSTGWRDRLTPPSSLLLDVPTSVKNQAKAKLRLRLKDEQWNAAVMLREMKDSVKMISGASSTLQRAMFCAIRKDFKGLAKALGVAPKKLGDATTPAQAWLSYHFGWAPIISDMVQAANFLATVGEHKPRLRVAAGASIGSKTDKLPGRIQLGGGTTRFYLSDWSIDYQQWDEVKTDYKLICWYELDTGWLRDLSKIGFTNPLELIYNTTTFSWLTEWLIPVGEVLTGLDATIGLKFLSGTETTYREVRRKVSEPEISMPVTTNSSQRTVLSKYGEVVVKGGMRSDSVRNVLTDTPFPTGLWINNPFSPWRIATSAALMRQMTEKFRFK